MYLKKITTTENKEEMLVKMIVLLSVIALCALLGCGGDDPTTPGEEVVSEKWKEPKDIGKTYAVEKEPEVGETVTLDTGEEYTVGDFDGIVDQGDREFFITTYVSDPDPDEPGIFIVREIIKRGLVVPTGPPIVALLAWGDTGKGYDDILPITKDTNIRDRIDLPLMVRIDRVLNYNLPIYVELQRQSISGEVTRVQFFGVVLKGGTWCEFGESKKGVGFDLGFPDEHERVSVSILPYTEMEKIDLPALAGLNPETVNLRVEDRVIPEGHKFRPYRIRSISFLIGVNDLGRNW